MNWNNIWRLAFALLGIGVVFALADFGKVSELFYILGGITLVICAAVRFDDVQDFFGW